MATLIHTRNVSPYICYAYFLTRLYTKYTSVTFHTSTRSVIPLSRDSTDKLRREIIKIYLFPCNPMLSCLLVPSFEHYWLLNKTNKRTNNYLSLVHRWLLNALNRKRPKLVFLLIYSTLLRINVIFWNNKNQSINQSIHL